MKYLIKHLSIPRIIFFALNVVHFTSGAVLHSKPLDSNVLASKIVKHFSFRESMGQTLFIHGKLPLSKKIIKQFKPGGIFLDFRNIPEEKFFNGKRRQDFKKLQNVMSETDRRFRKANLAPPIYAIDQENGYPKLFHRYAGFPSFAAIGEFYHKTKDIKAIENISYATCRGLRKHNILWNFSPIVDVQSNVENPVIGLRAFSSDAKLVTKIALAYLHGHKRAGCISTLKHFPGHGDTSRDSHIALPIVNKSSAEINMVELYPYKILLPQAPSVMTAHVLYQRQDKKIATLSDYWINNVLRREMNYTGLVISDNLAMKAVSRFVGKDNFSQVGFMSYKAGVDVLLLTSNLKTLGHSITEGLVESERTGKLQKKEVDFKAIKMLSLKLAYENNYSRWKSVLNSREIKHLQKNNQNTYKKTFIEYNNLKRRIASKAIVRVYPNIKSYAGANVSAVYSDVEKKDIVKTSYFKKKKILPINKMQSTQGDVLIINLKIKNYHKLLSLCKRRKKSQRLIVYTVGSPYPLSSLKFLRKGDVWISSLSYVRASRSALLKAVGRKNISRWSQL